MVIIISGIEWLGWQNVLNNTIYHLDIHFFKERSNRYNYASWWSFPHCQISYPSHPLDAWTADRREINNAILDIFVIIFTYSLHSFINCPLIIILMKNDMATNWIHDIITFVVVEWPPWITGSRRHSTLAIVVSFCVWSTEYIVDVA